MLFASVACWEFVSAQVRTITFTGRDQTSQYHIPLSKVTVFNLDQLWEEVLCYPDTVMTMGSVGIEDHEHPTGLRLMQNVPNPFNGATEFVLVLPKENEVVLEIYDISGRLTIGRRFTALPAGSHLFHATLVSPQTYLLGVTTQDGQTTIKMVNEGHGGENSIKHVGMVDTKGDITVCLKEDRAGTVYPFRVGDEMRYAGYAVVDSVELASQTVTQNQQDSETLILRFNVTVPTVITSGVNFTTTTTVVCSGNVTGTGGSNVTVRGVCWDTLPDPTISGQHTSDGSGTGSFTSNITGLSPGTAYYVRAYATNSVGTSYGEQRTFTTLPLLLPTVTTDQVSNVTAISAACGGNVTADGNTGVTARGVCWDTLPDPTINNQHTTDGGGIGSFTSNITGLSSGITYYVRAYATNSVGTSYGEQRTFTTPPLLLPTVTTDQVSNVTATSAACGGNVTADGNTGVTVRGVCWDTLPSPTISNQYTIDGGGTGSFTSNIIGLSSGTTYYARAYATNIVGTSYGEQRIFTTLSLPSIITNTVSNITGNAAVCGGNVVSEGDASVTAFGVCWSTSQNPTVNGPHTTDGSGTGAFSSSITGLTTGTTYYVRAYATSNVGTAYGEQLTFTTTFTCGNIIADYDGNTYNTVEIGAQCWMKQNLRTMHYADGTSIALGLTTSSTTEYRYYPNNSSINVPSYGYLYNWKAVMRNSSSSNDNPSGVQGICPTGWHVPSYAEWEQLSHFVEEQNQYVCGTDMIQIAKALAAKSVWHSYSGYNETCCPGYNQNSNNSTNFSATPAGRFDQYGFDEFSYMANMWSTTEANHNFSVWGICLNYDSPSLCTVNSWLHSGLSVRCLKN